MQLHELAPHFWDLHVLAENRPSQQMSVRQILDNWVLPHLGDKDADAITALDITRFRAAMLKAKLAPATINLRLKTLRKMLNWGHANGLCGPPPVIPLLKLRPTDAAFFSDAQMGAIFAAAGTPPWYAMIRIAAFTGMRIGELRAMHWEDVDLPEKRLRVRKATWSHATEVGPPKSGYARTIPLTHEAHRVLVALREVRKGNRLCFFLVPGKMLAYHTCRDALGVILRAAGIQGDYGWHSFRHTFASHIAMAGESLATLQKFLGHASITTTMRYAHLSPDAGHKAISALDKFKKS